MKILTVTLIVLFLGACASFKNSESNIVSLPDQSAYKNKPSAYIKVSYELAGKTIVDGEHVSKIQGDLSTLFHKSGLLSDYTFVATEQGNMDYRLDIKIRNFGDKAAASVAGFITGYSLFLIPTYATDNYSVQTILYKNGQQLSQFQEADSMKTWLGIWLLPFMGGSHPNDVSHNIIQNLIIKGLNDLIIGGSLEYSRIDGPIYQG